MTSTAGTCTKKGKPNTGRAEGQLAADNEPDIVAFPLSTLGLSARHSQSGGSPCPPLWHEGHQVRVGLSHGRVMVDEAFQCSQTTAVVFWENVILLLCACSQCC
jgi:hypothetical protein